MNDRYDNSQYSAAVHAAGGRLAEEEHTIVCCTDRRSAKAAALLARRGFADAHVVRGGMTAWLERGWPIERNSTQQE